MFLSDNGASAEGGLRGFSRGKKGAPIGSADSYASYGLGWANASNTPFRRFKARVHEGGIATPFIAYWPKGIVRRGELEHQVGHVMDILPTCVALAGADPSKGANASTRTPVQGRSLVDVFAGKKLPERTLFWEHQGDRAVRRGRWKLVAPHKGAWELYDLQQDRTELHDVSAGQAQRVRELAAEWEAWAKRAGVRPWPVKKKA